MRILHVLDHSIPLHSGYTFRTRAILEQQQAMGWQTFHVTSAKQGATKLPDETVDGLHFYRTPVPTSWLSQKPVFDQLAVVNSLARRLEEVIPLVKPEILHAHSPVLNTFAALRAGKRFGLPVIYEVRAFWEDAAVDHGTCKEGDLRYRITRALDTHAFRRVNAVTTICEGLRRDICERGIPSDKVTVIPNAVDIARFTQFGTPDVKLRQQLGLDGKIVLGFVGSYYAYEGLDLLIQALPKLIAELPQARLLLVGGGHEEPALKALAAQLGVADKVCFVGRVPHDQVQSYYDLIDILVYPRHSMRLTELVTPLKPLEAMAQGRLLVASDVGGHRELIRDGENGVLFRADDINDLVAKVANLARSTHLWDALRQRARQFVERERNWANSVGRYRAIYDRLCNKAG